MSKAPVKSPLRRWVWRIALGVVGLIVLAVVVGSVYEWRGRRRAARDFPPQGRLIDIGGRRIQLDCLGAGSPVVVFEAGLDINGSLAWSAVQDSVAKTTRACAYSRAGIMWSDSHRGPQNGTTIAEDLHATLSKAGELPPFVLVGHSLGGPYIMTYTKLYGDQVAGLVFVDASHPEQVERFKAIAPNSSESDGMMRLAAALAWTGVVRVAFPSSGGSPHQSPEAIRAMAAYAPTSLGPMLKENDALNRTLADAGTFRRLGDRPVVVLTAMAPFNDEILKAMKLTRAQADQFQAAWRSLHDEEASWSSRSRHELVPDATHYIQFDRPDVVIAAVRSVVDSVRAK